jgi:hypothetical protein
MMQADIKDPVAPVNLIGAPRLLSFEDLVRIKSLYINEHIGNECFSRWIGFNIPFVVCPNINSNVIVARESCSIIERENKKLLAEKPCPPKPTAVLNKI